MLSPDTPQVPLLYPTAMVVLTGLVVSLPRLPLLLRLPISVCELDCDIPSKKGLWRRSTARVSATRAQSSCKEGQRPRLQGHWWGRSQQRLGK